MEFFSEKELAMQIGHPREFWPLALLKELIDNSLDGAEAAGSSNPAAHIKVVVEENALSVQDNGPGIPAATVKRSLDYAVRISNKAYYVSPTRGALGNALKCVWAAPFVIGGNQGRAEVLAQGVRHDIQIALDRITGTPIIEYVTAKTLVKKGTFLKMHWPGVASYLDNYKWPHSYNAPYLLRAFSTFNPHARFSLGEMKLAPSNRSWQKWRPDQQTCPHWYSPEALRGLIAAYLAEERVGGRIMTVREFVAEFAGLTSTTKTKAVLAKAGLSGARLSDLVSGEDVDLDRITVLLEAMKAASRPVRSAALGVLGKEHLTRCLEQHFGCVQQTVQYRQRKSPQGKDGLPFVLEVAFGVKAAWQKETREVVVGLNWSPALKSPFDDLPWLLGKMRVDEHDPVTVLVHLACPKLGFTDRGKARLSLTSEVQDALASCIQNVAKQWKEAKRGADRQDRVELRDLERLRKSRQSDRMEIKAAAFQVMEQAYLETSTNGTYPANARQIMYKARPLVLALTGGTCWKNSSQFTQRYLPDFMKAHPALTANWDVVFDARGRFVEPHTSTRIDLGTLHVRQYIRLWKDEFEDRLENPSVSTSCPTSGPANRYRFALFVEKEGFAPLLERANIAGRYDVAVMSTKGMSVTAARSLAESLTEKGVTVLVLRDFDKAGFSIVHTLGNDTRRYSFATKPLLIDFGLRLEDVGAMSLTSEPVEYKGGSAKKPLVDPRFNLRACGATDAECNFLVQGRSGSGWAGERVELNAMTSEQFINFIEEKLRKHGVRKLVPNQEVLAKAYRRAAAAEIVNRGILEIVATAYDQARSATVPRNLEKKVRRMLKSDQSIPWDVAVARIVAETI